MNEKTLEEVSALMDGEMASSEATRLLDQVGREPALRTAWERYHLIGDVLRNSMSDVEVQDFVGRVRYSIESEPVPFAQRRKRFSATRVLGGLALAASVAIVAVIGVQLGGQQQPTTSQVAEVEVTAPATKRTQFAGARWDVEHPAVEARLNRYLVNHSEYLDKGMWGVLPYARIVSYDDGK